ncbi:MULTISPECIES: PAS domain-containing protein [unclassified Methanoregula]|uniref:PAS domain-containing protein n=1 Tax=unclassified Methanoregula TaxID=2649730 RepID=UPI0009C7054A|nr:MULTISPECIES: PAS domain-containing protein [unclassified Methanoregula]OPX61795.1 MAG: PAS fold protein [Methanoregula sp. PtaB.Bin085]OPY33895.1 MAG: PAS fold protein [Methanoregula sp. PtaU1.Bin006]
MNPGPDPRERIKAVLRANPRGLGITETAQKARMHRNVVAKYLDILRVSGEAEMRRAGMTKIYTLARRVPVSAMLGLSEDIVVVIDETGKILQANEPYLTLCRIPDSEIIGANPAQKDLPLLSDPEVLAAVRADEDINGITRSVTATGNSTIRHFRIRIVPTVLEGGKSGTTVIGADITREEELRQDAGVAETRSRQTIDMMPMPVCNLSCNCVITSANQAFCEIFSGPKGAVMDRPFSDVTGCDDSALRRQLGTLAEPGARNPVIEQCIRPDHPAQVFRWYFVPERNASGTMTGIGVFGIDLSKEKEAQKREHELQSRFRFITEKTQEFLDLPADADIWHTIAEGVRQIVPDAAVTVSSFDPGTPSLTVRSLVGDDGVILKHYPGTIGAVIPVRDPEVLALISMGGISPVLGGVHIASFGTIPVVTSARIEEELPVASICGISLKANNTLMGVAAMFKRLPGPVRDEELLLAYGSLASLALQAKYPDGRIG